ncbi:hypothetical protein [Citricoccus sp.]|uniref:hypothetical protein n=1 Tax=Citricoccus sp. TaxID=1978372 RepID=UPI0028BE2216|nr:hypothetical protein [Citricoccus sp.]
MSTATLTQAGPAPAASAHHGMNPVLRIVRLHFVDRLQMFWVPIIMLASVAAVCVVIFLLLVALTPATADELTEGFRYNQAALWSWPGFIVTIGVYAYARTMPFAIGMMGSTRRHYWAGTALWIVVHSVYLAALIGIFLLLEQATGHWFTGARMFDVYALGDGDLGAALLISFAIALVCLSVGAGLAAVYLRWGQYGVMAGIAGLLIIILGAVALVLGTGVDLMTFFTTNLIAKIAGLLVVIAVLANGVSWLVMRKVPVGR